MRGRWRPLPASPEEFVSEGAPGEAVSTAASVSASRVDPTVPIPSDDGVGGMKPPASAAGLGASSALGRRGGGMNGTVSPAGLASVRPRSDPIPAGTEAGGSTSGPSGFCGGSGSGSVGGRGPGESGSGRTGSAAGGGGGSGGPAAGDVGISAAAGGGSYSASRRPIAVSSA
jgi:hypothetical protein